MKPRSPVITALYTARQVVRRTEDVLCVSLLLLMVLLAVTQIVLRNFFSTGIVWGDALVRTSVLWTALLGAMVATRDRGHINIDVVTRYLPERAKRISGSIVALFSAGVCGFLTWTGYEFVAMEREFLSMAFADVPVWVCALILPIAFAVMTIRYLLSAIALAVAAKRLDT